MPNRRLPPLSSKLAHYSARARSAKPSVSCVNIKCSIDRSRSSVTEHLSRKELKQDKIRESFEHGAEAVYSHSTVAGIVVAIILVIVVGYAGWKFYMDRQTLQASVGL